MKFSVLVIIYSKLKGGLGTPKKGEKRNENSFVSSI